MPSHSATLIEAIRSKEQWQVRARLACGCDVRVTVPDDRVVVTVGGGRILVGKYPCPSEHPVKAAG